MERNGTMPSDATTKVLALTILGAMDGSLFGDPPGGLKTKQEKFDTRDGWSSVEDLARHGVPYEAFLHQRHYGGAFRQLLDATSRHQPATTGAGRRPARARSTTCSANNSAEASSRRELDQETHTVRLAASSVSSR